MVNHIMSLEEIANTVIQKYPQTTKFKNRDHDLRIPITEEVTLSVNFKNFPNQPKVALIRYDGRKFKLKTILSYLRDWDESGPFALNRVVEEVFLLVNSILNRQIPFRESCFQGLVKLCKDQHPRKIQGVLSVNRGMVSELVIPAVRCIEPERLNYVNLQPICSLPFDLSYEGTFISRPDGDLSMNENLSKVIRRKRFTMLLAYPYDDPNKLKIYDQSGKELEYKILS